jgi:hypothetical protein
MADNTVAQTPERGLWVTDAINALMDGSKDAVVSATKDLAETANKGDSKGTTGKPQKTSLQPMSEIASATSGSGSYLQMVSVTSEATKAITVSHKHTLEDMEGHLHDPKAEAPADMLQEIERMLGAMHNSMEDSKEQHDKPTGIQFVSDSQMRINSPTVDMGGRNVSIAGTHGQLAFNTQTNTSKCNFNWHQISMQDVKFVHNNYQVRNSVVGTDSKSGVSSRQYFNEISSDASHSISATTKLHSIDASDIEEKASNITSRAVQTQDVQAGEGYTLTVGQGTAKGPAPHFFMAGGIGAIAAQKALQIGLSKVGGGGGLLGGLVGNPTPGVVIRHTPQGSNYVSPKVTSVMGSETTNITGMARRVVHKEAVNVANRLLADVSKGVKLEGVAGGVLTMVTKKFSFSMGGWLGELINKVIGEVVGCIEFPELPKLPEVTLPRVPQISCMPEQGKEGNGSTQGSTMKVPPTASKGDGESHKEGVHSDKYPMWFDNALKEVTTGISGKVALDQEAVSGTDASKVSTPLDKPVATFGAPLMIYKDRAPVLGLPDPPKKPSPVRKGTAPGNEVDNEMAADGVPQNVQALLKDYVGGALSKADTLSIASSMGVNLSPYMDRSNLPATMADILGVGAVTGMGKTPLSLETALQVLTGAKSNSIGDVIEAVLGQVPGINGESISLQQALQDIGLGVAVGKDGTLESAELLGALMEKAGIFLPEGVMEVKGDTVTLDVDKVMDGVIDKAVSFLGDMDPILKADRLLKLIGMNTPLTNLLNDLSECAKAWVNIRAILKLPDIALDSISGKIGKIRLPGLDMDFLRDWSLCGGGSKKGQPILWDGVQQGQKGYQGDGVGTA